MHVKMSDHKGIAIKVFEKSHVLLEREIGHGSFGKVYIGAIPNANLSPVAVKVFFKEFKNRGQVCPADKEKAYEELLKVAVIDHENIVKLHGMVQDDLPWLVFEYMKDGNLLEFVRNTSRIRERDLVAFCRDICSGMVFLHKNQILHKDLAARNILLSDNTAKIADLGLSSFLTNNDEGIYTLNGKLFPFRHAARECIVEQLFTYESDVWSFGILMYEIFSGGSTPYGRENKETEVRRLIADHITPIHIKEPQCSSKLYALINSTLTPDLLQRPTFSQLHATFEKLLHGKSNVESAQQNNENISSALSAFHQIKTNGLSNSINNLNLQISSSSSSTNVGRSRAAQTSQTKDGLLTVLFNNHDNMSRSSSTPDLTMEEAPNASTKGVNNGKGTFRLQSTNPTGNKLTVRVPFGVKDRRYSADLLGKTPLGSVFNGGRHEDGFEGSRLHQSGNLSTSPVTRYLDDAVGGDEPTSRQSGSSVVHNHLFDGFVQNRFTNKRKS